MWPNGSAKHSPKACHGQDGAYPILDSDKGVGAYWGSTILSPP